MPTLRGGVLPAMVFDRLTEARQLLVLTCGCVLQSRLTGARQLLVLTCGCVLQSRLTEARQ